MIRLPHFIAWVCVLLFAVSSAFPILASFLYTDVDQPPPSWVGIADVLTGAALFATTAWVVHRRQHAVTNADRIEAFHLSQVVFAIVPALLIVFFVAGDRIRWPVLVIGMAWRGWLLLYALPYLVSATRGS